MNRYVNAFRWVVAALLFATAFLKTVSLIGGQIPVYEIEPISGISLRLVLAAVAITEALIACFALMPRFKREFLFVNTILFGSFAIYHVMSYAMQIPKPCSCLGFSFSRDILMGLDMRAFMLGSTSLFATVSFLMLRIVTRRYEASVLNCRVVTAVALFFLAPVLRGQAETVSFLRATGIVQIATLDRKGKPMNRQGYESPVNLTVGEGGRFYMEFLNGIQPGKKPVTFASDGETYYYLINPHKVSRVKASDQTVSGDPISAYLSSESIPMILFQDHARDALWYAIASGYFFERNGPHGEIVQLFHWPRMNVNAYGFRYSVELTNSIVAFPTLLEIRKDISLDKKSLSEEENARLSLDAKSNGSEIRQKQWHVKRGWKDGNLAVKVECKKWEIVGNHVAPSEIEVTDYFAFPHSEPPRMKIAIKLSAWESGKCDSDSFIPEVNEVINVMDTRLRSRNRQYFVDEINYQIGRTNNQWLQVNDVRLQTHQKYLLKSNQLQNSARTGIYRVILLGFVALLIGASCYAWAYKKKGIAIS